MESGSDIWDANASMPASKRPKRKYKPRPVVRPFGRDGWKFEGQVHAALMSLDADRLQPEHLAHIIAHATMAGRMAEKVGDALALRHAESILRICQQIKDHPLYDGHIPVSDLDKLSLHASIGVTLDWLRERPNPIVNRVARECLEELRLHQLRREKQENQPEP